MTIFFTTDGDVRVILFINATQHGTVVLVVITPIGCLGSHGWDSRQRINKVMEVSLVYVNQAVLLQKVVLLTLDACHDGVHVLLATWDLPIHFFLVGQPPFNATNVGLFPLLAIIGDLLLPVLLPCYCPEKFIFEAFEFTLLTGGKSHVQFKI